MPIPPGQMPGGPMPGGRGPGAPIPGQGMNQGGLVPPGARPRPLDGPGGPLGVPGRMPNRPGDMDATAGLRSALDGTSDEDSIEILTANLVHRPASRGLLVGVFLLVIALLVVVPGYFVIMDGKHNPAFTAMDGLAVPTWADGAKHDESIYSRFCVAECQINERDSSSARSVDETQAAYATALTTAGWQQSPASRCTTKTTGSYTCWVLDERELDLWVRPSVCTLPAPPKTEGDLTDPDPSAAPTTTCAPTAVQVKIFDSVERNRVQGPTSG